MALLYPARRVLEHELHGLVAEEATCAGHEHGERSRKIERCAHECEHVTRETGHEHARHEYFEAESITFDVAVQIPRDTTKHGKTSVQELYRHMCVVVEHIMLLPLRF